MLANGQFLNYRSTISTNLAFKKIRHNFIIHNGKVENYPCLETEKSKGCHHTTEISQKPRHICLQVNLSKSTFIDKVSTTNKVRLQVAIHERILPHIEDKLINQWIHI